MESVRWRRSPREVALINSNLTINLPRFHTEPERAMKAHQNAAHSPSRYLCPSRTGRALTAVEKGTPWQTTSPTVPNLEWNRVQSQDANGCCHSAPYDMMRLEESRLRSQRLFVSGRPLPSTMCPAQLYFSGRMCTIHPETSFLDPAGS